MDKGAIFPTHQYNLVPLRSANFQNVPSTCLADDTQIHPFAMISHMQDPEETIHAYEHEATVKPYLYLSSNSVLSIKYYLLYHFLGECEFREGAKMFSSGPRVAAFTLRG